jgi:hypothetical protein
MTRDLSEIHGFEEMQMDQSEILIILLQLILDFIFC